MKRVLCTILFLATAATTSLAQFPEVSVRQLQEVPAESLALADGITNFGANSTQPRWTLQVSPYNADTVGVTAQVVVPPGIITYSAGVWTMLVYDTTANATGWGGIFLRASIADSNQLKVDGFLNVKAGDIIHFVGVVSEFPTSRGTSATQIQPVAGHPITILGSKPLPKPLVKNIGDFYTGAFSTGTIKFATGEPLEGMYVEFHNVTVNNKVSTSRGTFSFVDGAGNEMSDYDWSHYFTLGHGTSSLPLYPADTAWARIYAAMGNGTRIDTIRGYITTASGSEGPRGYRICPVYPGDVVFDTGFGSLEITLYDAENWGQPGTNARIELYNGSGVQVAQGQANANSVVTFNSIAPGSGYYYRVYVNRITAWGEQFRGEKTGITIIENQITYDTHTQNTPYMPNVSVYIQNTNELLPDGGLRVVQPGTPLRIELDIKNPTYAGAQDVIANGGLYFDRDRSAPYDVNLSSVPEDYGIGVTKKAVFYCNAPALPGDYYLSVSTFASSNRYNTVLTDASSWHDPAFSVGSGVVAYYPFSGNANDASGNGNNGTVSGATLTADRFGSLNRAYFFDRVNAYIQTPYDLKIQSGNTFSFACWFKTDSTNISGIYMGCGSEALHIGFGHYADTKKLWANCRNGTISDLFGNTVLSNDTWYFAAFVVNGTNVQFYLNGAADGSGTFSVEANPSTNARVGSRDDDWNVYGGLLDEIRIYNRALRGGEIDTLYHEGGWPPVVAPPWRFTNTGISHTIVIPTGANPNINGTSLVSGDYVGVFYDSSGTLTCAGYERWTGTNNIALSAFGDDPTSNAKDGLLAGEVFKWKIFKADAGNIVDAEATYSQVGGLITHANTYSTNGISQLVSLVGGITTHCTSLRAGWSLISSYVMPQKAALDSLFKSVVSNVIIVKNGAQKTYIPSIMVNSIGPWVSTEGYQIKMATARSLCVAGQKIVPWALTIPLPLGWSLMPYVRDSEMAIASALSGIVGDIVMVKDQDAKTYIPSVGVNGIGTLKVGQAYQIKMSAARTMEYPAKSALSITAENDNSTTSAHSVRVIQPWYFTNTGVSHTVIVPTNANPMIDGTPITAGDVIGVFYDSLGTQACAGYDVWTGTSNVAIAVFGDDATTPAKDGLSSGETIRWKIWRQSDAHVFVATASYVSLGGLGGIVSDTSKYSINGISAVSGLTGSVTSVAATDMPTEYTLLQNYPNPFNPSTTIAFGMPARGRVRVTVYSTLGEEVAELANDEMEAGYHEVKFDATNLSSGVYFYRMQAGTFTETKKLLLVR